MGFVKGLANSILTCVPNMIHIYPNTTSLGTLHIIYLFIYSSILASHKLITIIHLKVLNKSVTKYIHYSGSDFIVCMLFSDD